MQLIVKSGSLLLLAVASWNAQPAAGEGFLKQDPRLNRRVVDRDAEFQNAMAAVMGCRGPAGDQVERLRSVEQALAATWAVLPKNEHGRVGWKMLRYAAHRYFLQQASLLIRGFEPARQVNDTHLGAAELMSKHSSLVETVLQGKRLSNGFSFEDAVALVATMEEVIFEAEGSMLEHVYASDGKALTERLSHKELADVLEAYMVNWMLGEDQDVIDIVLRNRTILESAIPHWDGIRHFLEGMLKSLEHRRQKEPTLGSGLVVMSQTFSFQEACSHISQVTSA
eukprot:TRINITY_DN13674_c0_g1_i3.p1 TRINITY_DN13674_c0_g1~~TRINITY_DN13674_c0_g1_i3.p1  ORF type:complete len:282 (-),score=76.42 TRINITY_DN13674_c0_g1_i3:1110-1955(-)